MKLLFSTAFAMSMLTFFLPSGNYGGFLVMFRGTNNATPKTRADVGNTNLTWNGNPLINVDFEMLQRLTDLKGGFTNFTSTASGVFTAGCYIPAGKFNDKNNIYRIDNDEKVYFKLDFPNLADISGQVYIYGIPKEGIMNYQYCITSRNVSVGGAGTSSDVHRINNVNAMYLLDHSIVDSIQIQRDNKTLIDGLTPDIQALSDFNNQIETTNTLIELDLNRSNDVREILSNEIIFKYAFNAGGTLKQYFSYIQLTPSQARKSLVSFEADVQEKISKGLGVVDGVPVVGINKKMPALS